MTETVGGVSYSVDVDLSQLMQLDSVVDKTTKDVSKKFGDADKAVAKAGKAMSDAGGDAKKLASDISSTVSSTTEAIAAYNKMSSSLQAQRDGVAQYIAKLKEQNETLGLSAAELAQYQAAKLGASETDKRTIANLQSQIEAYSRNQAELAKQKAALAAAEAAQEENRKSVSALIQSLKEYEATIGMTTQELTLYKAAQRGATVEDLAAIKSQFALIDAKEKANAENMRLNKTSGAVKGALGGLGRSAGMAGIQIQQFVGQIQGGVSPMVALSQQGADLGFVLGAPLLGAIVSISAALGGMLFNSLTSGADTTESLTEKLKALKDEMGLTASQSAQLAEQEKDSLQDKYATIKALELQIFNTEKLISKMSMAGTGLDGGQFAIPRSAEDNIKRYGDSLESARRTIIKNRAEIDLLNSEIQKSKENIDAYSKGAVDAEKNQQMISDTIKEITNQTAIMAERLLAGDDAANRLSIALKLGLTNAEMLPPEIEKAVAALERARAEAEAESEFRREILAEQKQAIADIESERKTAHQQELERIRSEDAERKKLEAVAGGSLGLTRLQQLAQQYEQEKQLLLAAQNAKIESEIAYQDRLTQLEVSYSEARAAEIQRIQESQTTNTKSALEMAGFSYEQLSNQAIGTFAAIASGAQSGTDAIRSLAQSILTQAIGALIKMAFTAAAGQTAAVASGVATAGALSAAYATPAALASLASFGANAAPASAGIASTVALAQGLSLGGGRLYGGPVDSGKLYPITENGKPEILQQGAKQYLLPGSRGNVISNGDMAQAAGGAQPAAPIININNYGGGGASVQNQMYDATHKRWVINVVAGDVKGRGQIQRAVTETTTASNKL